MASPGNDEKVGVLVGSGSGVSEIVTPPRHKKRAKGAKSERKRNVPNPEWRRRPNVPNQRDPLSYSWAMLCSQGPPTPEQLLEPSHVVSDVPLTRGEEELLLRAPGAAIFPRPPFITYFANGEYILSEDGLWMMYETAQEELWLQKYEWKKEEVWLENATKFLGELVQMEVKQKAELIPTPVVDSETEDKD